MSVEIDDLTIDVTASFGMKVGLPNYSGKDAHVSFAVKGQAVPNGATTEQIIKAMYDLHDALIQGAKLAVFADLDHAYDPTTMQPIATVSNIPVAAPPYAAAPIASAAAPRPQGQGGGGQQYAAPKADLSKVPQLLMDFFGDGRMVAVYDQRALKADGTYSPKAPDFKTVEKFQGENGKVDHQPLWLSYNGAPVQRTVDLLANAVPLATAGVHQAPDTSPF